MVAVLLTLGSAFGVMVVGCALLLAIREYRRHHQDPAWKPTGYRVRC